MLLCSDERRSTHHCHQYTMYNVRCSRRICSGPHGPKRSCGGDNFPYRDHHSLQISRLTSGPHREFGSSLMEPSRSATRGLSGRSNPPRGAAHRSRFIRSPAEGGLNPSRGPRRVQSPSDENVTTSLPNGLLSCAQCRNTRPFEGREGHDVRVCLQRRHSRSIYLYSYIGE